MRTPCGLRTVVTILEIFAELLGDTIGKVPCYNTVENWVKKLGLSVYHDEQPCKDKKFAMVIDASIPINGQKLLLTLAIPSKHQGRPIKHEDVTILDMSVSKGFNGDDVQSRTEEAEKSAGNAHSRQVHAGIKMLEYFNREEALLTANMSINVSSDIIESTFGINKSKKSPNKLYGITSFVLTIPLYPKVSNESVTKTINFKERIVNVKLKDISTWSTEHLSKNWVTERTKTLRKVS